ncbi:DUF302 domain-containing protein [Rhizobium rhizogenes]|jgi:uncharacterized protein (DUF302 family)|uniref:DUF302 domain-containing protein n=1 Tax=Rhizobium rhizogenes TaxID=359 RepID=UPI00056917B3|nr:DUF302 domain-containing protein [Rhizobium rhizogenes]NTF85352.1 DUF302 domain-containing protein [Rhizobium rhizogenes]NTG45719.1 DUF302 domain-containing protein [Rhizobium rhizogenes]NTI24904.1 DUF302 domain-containing protein [Rhizobium rhizogenes]NTI78178.1 DUF302 domain-containing protein [Rhizobium rhizogenes]QTG08678.1 DUF302 domain-containing protein [Rhizobium rhizogenes]
MTYTLDKTLSGSSFDVAVEKTKAALTREGFGVLTEIDVKATMKKKLDAHIGNYLILGACNPGMAFEAINMEPKVGAMLPCNVIVRSLDSGDIMVSAIDPVASMQAIENAALKQVARNVRAMLEQVIASI